MEEQELIEAKRARNFIWTAAEKYEFEPMFLAFSPDGTADMYLNLIIGLAYKWYDQEKIEMCIRDRQHILQHFQIPECDLCGPGHYLWFSEHR